MSATNLILPSLLLDQVLAHCREAYPREAVGLLGGVGTSNVTTVFPLENIAEGNRAFIADPYSQYCALRRLRADCMHLLGIYHSHPDGGVEPSQQDIAHARRWVCAHVIVALAGSLEPAPRLRAFRCDGDGQLSSVTITVSSSASAMAQ
jgi:proteasome lid subunit RPN8/RPN11